MKILKRKPSKICPCCGKRFFKKKDRSTSNWIKQNYCSSKCSKIKFPIKIYLQNKYNDLMSKTQKTITDCFELKKCITSKGYGRIPIFGKNKSAHRFVWELLKGDIPEGLCVCHHCDNPKCINPDHLFLGTFYDNNHDKINKGKQPKGLQIHSAKLSESDKIEVIELYKKGISHKNIAIKFGMIPNSIGRFLRQNGFRRYGNG